MKYGLHSPRSRQNAVTVCPLRACSEISSRHFVQAFFVRRVMAQHCYTRAHPARCGSLIAHRISVELLSGMLPIRNSCVLLKQDRELFTLSPSLPMDKP